MKASREIFTRYLHESGRRCTFERYAVLEQVLATPGHFSADALHSALTAAGNTVSIATVYNTLDLLVDCGMATRHRFERGTQPVALYQRVTADRRAAARHHLVCTRCGKVSQPADPELAAMIKAKRWGSFEAQYYVLDIYGLCGACRRRMRSRRKSSEK